MGLFFTYYAESNIVCLIIFAIMLLHDMLRVDRQEKQRKYDRALIAFMLYFASDTVWAAVVAGLIPKTIASVIICNFLNYLFMALITYNWLRYALAALQVPYREKPSFRRYTIFPLLLSIAVAVFILVFKPELFLNEALETMLTYSVFQIAVPILYIITILVYSINKALHEKNPADRGRYLYVGLFPLLVVASGLLQILAMSDTPVFCFGSAIFMLIFYIQSMEGQISLDPLTGLNNRGQLLRYISQDITLRREGKHTCVLMVDVNDFKPINDNYGHAEGDRALVLIADSLKTAAKKSPMPVFLGRYGGDEFIVIAHPDHLADIDGLVSSIRDCISSSCTEEQLPYRLTVGIGCDELKGPGEDSFERCMERADEKLYADKKRVKAAS